MKKLVFILAVCAALFPGGAAEAQSCACTCSRSSGSPLTFEIGNVESRSLCNTRCQQADPQRNSQFHACPAALCCIFTFPAGSTQSTLCDQHEAGFDCFSVKPASGTFRAEEGRCESIPACAPTTPGTVAAPPAPPPFVPILPRLSVPIPTISLPDFLAVKQEGGFVFVPFIAVYLAGVFKFGVAAAAVLAVIMIMVGGFRWIIAGGGPQVAEAKKMISNAVIGLFIAFGTYTVLELVNPDLIRFKNLKLPIVEGEVVAFAGDEADILEEGQHPMKPSWTHASFDCNNPPPAAGVAPASSVEAVTCPGMSGTANVLRELKDPLCRAASAAQAKGYTLVVTSSYRPYQKQVDLWCGKEGDCFKKYENTAERKKFCAVPGFSNHGLGRAVDVSLEKDGKRLFYISSTGQCKVDPKVVADLGAIFYGAGWKRYEAEIWHFEHGTNLPARGEYTGLPSKCR